MFARFFIERPIFAWVVAIVIMLAGIVAIRTLPVAQYPDVAPPSVNISANYPGASAQALENSVTQVLEQQLTGLDGLLYFSSSSSSSGRASITATFRAGTDPDTAQVQVQNKVAQATSRLPTEVQQQGVTVSKANSDFLMLVALYDESDKRTAADIADYMVTNLQDPLSRVEGVGSYQTFGSQYAMRIWLDPSKLAAVGLIPSDVANAVRAQNTQVSAGTLGSLPAPPNQQLVATVTAQSRLQTPDEFREILLKTRPDGSQVKLKDVARVELGDESYGFISRLNGHPASGMAIQLAPGANALATSERVKATVDAMAENMPAGYRIAYPVDSTAFIKISIEEVVKTLVEATVLVILVMFLFLQNWRATLIPAIAVPVVLLGTFGVLALFGYSINTLTLFAMVLAIGLLVDDAIVVVENVERVMSEEGLPPFEATVKSMGEITSALFGITVVLSAVFLPMALFGGSTGVIYRQFSITIVAAMALSVLVALTLTPALCATLLKPIEHKSHDKGFFGWFNRNFDRGVGLYVGSLTKNMGRPIRFVVIYGALAVVLALLFVRMPTGFLPTEDQGRVMVQVTLPTGAAISRSNEANLALEKHFLQDEKHNTDAIFTLSGFSFAGAGQNAGMAFISLKDWKERKGKDNSADAIAGRAIGALSTVRDASIFALTPPAISGLGQSNGFTYELLAAPGMSRDELLGVRNQLLGAANQDSELQGVRPNSLEDTPQLHVTLDNAKAAAMGLSQADINSTLSAAWGGSYINDFIDRGRVKRVFMQGEADTRSKPEDLGRWFVRGSSGAMTPFSAFATTDWVTGPDNLTRFNGRTSFEIQGQAAPGGSSGQAMAAMERLTKALPGGVDFAWSSLSYQEKLSSGQAPLLYGVSLLVIFLCLAALYESWSIPFSVMLVIPLGIIGAVVAATLRGLENDIYFQVGLLTTMGLSAKNAILIVEFAEAAEKQGKDPFDAAVEAARLRLRPILMTSLAFIAGVIPLAISTGAGANSRIAIGTGVIGGMLTATVLAIFYVPFFFVLIRGLFRSRRKPAVAGEAV
ncbi:efflux RND transporter permease subunit [Caulobacter mirabilis]|uniref:Efflux pump membrane transporter n=1 Tax=Caulobacter mirabilis TaxID=69666 RepID=A0A2D2AUJ8_9CAUL|nr:efflux RND transporter permease subunit [Caulobacter mirabilis]ATQ41679.1 hydrophobe/amphiphile efflux-1 family RND transporter [Caulobacter mirabilis]